MSDFKFLPKALKREPFQNNNRYIKTQQIVLKNIFNPYRINSLGSKQHTHARLSAEQIERVFQFSLAMSHGKHKTSRFDQPRSKEVERQSQQIFQDTFRGKLGEFGFYNYVLSQEIEHLSTSEPDLSVHDLGIWDAGDFEIRFKEKIHKVAVKTTKEISNNLLLERTCWYVENGRMHYSHANVQLKQNSSLDETTTDRIYLCRVKNAEIKNDLNRLTIMSIPERQEYFKAQNIEYEICGYINSQDLAVLIANAEKFIIPRHGYLGSTSMITDNYYVQVGCLRPANT